MPAVRIQVNPRALASYGISLDNIRTQVNNLNVNTPKGSFSGPAQSYTINANDQITDASEYAALIVAYKNGTPVRLGDVANIVAGAENAELGRLVRPDPGDHPERAAPAGCQRHRHCRSDQGGAADAHQRPAGGAPRSAVLSDGTTSIRASVGDAEFELLLSVAWWCW